MTDKFDDLVNQVNAEEQQEERRQQRAEEGAAEQTKQKAIKDLQNTVNRVLPRLVTTLENPVYGYERQAVLDFSLKGRNFRFYTREQMQQGAAAQQVLVLAHNQLGRVRDIDFLPLPRNNNIFPATIEDFQKKFIAILQRETA